MRAMGLKGIRVETAGQTGTIGSALVTVVGIVDTDDFRDLVLEQRDRVADRDDAPPPSAVAATAVSAGGAEGAVAAADPALLETLTEIRDLLRRIEAAVSRAASSVQ
jgi:putative membrane protein